MMHAFWAMELVLAFSAQRAPASAPTLSAPAGELEQVRAAIPDRPYYPPGYREMRIAAALEHRSLARWSVEGDPALTVDPGRSVGYDLNDCVDDEIDMQSVDERQRDLGFLAIQVSRHTEALGRIGYRREVYAAPLETYERRALAALAAHRPESGETFFDPTEGLVGPLARDLDTRRARLQPRMGRIVAEGGCGAGEEEFRVRAAPANGRVWLISAFQFHVCVARRVDAWRVDACRWTEMDPGSPAMLSGRYMYQVRWPDGAVRRGIRQFEPSPGAAGPGTVIIQRQ